MVNEKNYKKKSQMKIILFSEQKKAIKFLAKKGISFLVQKWYLTEI